MNPEFIDSIRIQVRQIANMLGVTTVPFDAVGAATLRENIFKIAQGVENEEPQIASQLIRAKEILFAANRFGQAVFNPVALGEVIFGLDYLYTKRCNQENDMWKYIHPLIQKSSKQLFLDGHFANSAVDAFVEINDRVKNLFKIIKPDCPIPDGSAAITHVFSVNNPLIEFCDQSTETGKNKQKGYMEMLAGSISAFRNPKAHSNKETLSAEEAYQRLVTASMLMYAIDDAVKYSNVPEKG